MVGSKRPRHVLLLGCVISCIFILFSDLIAVVYYLSHSEYLCRFYVAIYIVPYIDFLYNLLWSLTDRLVAINRSVWHCRFFIGFHPFFLVVNACRFSSEINKLYHIIFHTNAQLKD